PLPQVRPTGLLLLLVLVGCEGRDAPGRRQDPGEAGRDEPMAAPVTLASEKLELFMEHPSLVRGEGAKFNVHLTVLKDGTPIRSGKLRVVGTGPAGKTVTVVQDAPQRPGTYGPVVAFPEAGENEMSISVESDQARDTIRVPVMVYPDRA